MITFNKASRLIKRGDVIALRNALENGLSPNCKNKHSWTLLMTAATIGNISIGEMLISKGADVNATTTQGGSALGKAILGGHIPFIQLLLSHGASTGFLKKNPVEEWIKYGSLPQNKVDQILNILNPLRIN